MTYEFDAEIKRLEGKIQWSVFYFPKSAERVFWLKGQYSRRKLRLTGIRFSTPFSPSRNGHYLVYNEFIRRTIGKDIGDVVRVTLEKDEQPRVFTTPAYLEKALADGGV